MKVSVIVPSYNHERFVEASVISVLNQSYREIEIIVIDDGSKDRSPEILKELARKYPLKLVLKENEGICRTLNRGIELATGDLITFLASDDLMTPHRIKEQVEIMRADPSLDVLAGAHRVINDEGEVVSQKTPGRLGILRFEQMLNRNMVFAPTAIVRADVYKRFGTYDPEMVFEDYHMWLRILRKGGKILNTDRIWAHYRVSAANQEKRFRWYHTGFVQCMTPYLPDERVRRGLARYDLVYAVKMTLLLGREFLTTEASLIRKLNIHHRMILEAMSCLPGFLRQKVLQLLLLHF